jgi:hypothetical protein
MLSSSILKVLAVCSVLVGGTFIAGYSQWDDSSAISNRLGNERNEKAKNNPTPDAKSPALTSLPPRPTMYPNSSVSIAINQNGNIRRADPRGYIDVAIRETYKIEIFSPNYASAVSVKIDGVSIIDGLICDRSVTLERPRAIAKQFIVLEEGNPGLDRDGGVNNPNLGLIEVTFMPIKRRAIAYETLPRPQVPSSSSVPAPMAPSPLEQDSKSGIAASRSTPVGTGLSGTSSQEFIATNDWVEAPEIAPTYTKKYRLVGISFADPVTLHNMTRPRQPQVVDPAPPRL